MLEFELFVKNYGWLGFFGYVAVKEAWPFFRDRVWPRKIAIEAAERERLKNLEERSALSEERQAKAIESMSLSVQQMALGIATNNERLTQLNNAHAEHARFAQDALLSMRARISPSGITHKSKKKI